MKGRYYLGRFHPLLVSAVTIAWNRQFVAVGNAKIEVDAMAVSFACFGKRQAYRVVTGGSENPHRPIRARLAPRSANLERAVLGSVVDHDRFEVLQVANGLLRFKQTEAPDEFLSLLGDRWLRLGAENHHHAGDLFALVGGTRRRHE